MVQIVQRECLEKFLAQKTFSRLQVNWYFEVEKLHFFATGLVYGCSQKFDISYLSFFSAKVIEKSVHCLDFSLLN